MKALFHRCLTDKSFLANKINGRKTLSIGKRIGEREEESGSNRTDVKETDFDNRHNCEEKEKRAYILSKNSVRETEWEAKM